MLTLCSYQLIANIMSASQVDQYSFAQPSITDQYTWHSECLHDRPDDDRAGGYDFFAAFL